MRKIRNFCIIAHIDHGKSTLADRFIEKTETVHARDMKEQLLDRMDLERERGITIKLQPVRMAYTLDGSAVQLNLIDTPGHVDFTYEVSRTLSAVEGALLLVDASQGVEAQTVSNVTMAIDQGLTIIPVVNKIDLPHADVERVRQEIVHLLGCRPEDISAVSAKTGEGVEDLLRRIIKEVPGPSINEDVPLRALIFDSHYDTYRGVIVDVRIVDGIVRAEDRITFTATGADAEVADVGLYNPEVVATDALRAGDIGFIATGLKDLSSCRVGDTVTLRGTTVSPLPGYKEATPMVFAGVYPKDGDQTEHLTVALEKLRLNDASITFTPDHSDALGFGYRMGFLGLLHMDIIRERLEREYDLEIIMTVPSVVYHVTWQGAEESVDVASPSELPKPEAIERIEEPWVTVDVIVPSTHIGGVTGLLDERRAENVRIEYLDVQRVIIHGDMPLVRILTDFYDRLKSVSSGYASMSYTLTGYRPAKVARLDILIAEEEVEALTTIVHTDDIRRRARSIVERLKDIIPRQQFVVKIQARGLGEILASSKIPALRKDVTAKLYGGDVTRKRKLLEKQKRGKKRMRSTGTVDLPQEAFRAVFSAEGNQRKSG